MIYIEGGFIISLRNLIDSLSVDGTARKLNEYLNIGKLCRPIRITYWFRAVLEVRWLHHFTPEFQSTAQHGLLINILIYEKRITNWFRVVFEVVPFIVIKPIFIISLRNQINTKSRVLQAMNQIQSMERKYEYIICKRILQELLFELLPHPWYIWEFRRTPNSFL